MNKIYGGFGRRFIAGIIDQLILFLIFLVYLAVILVAGWAGLQAVPFDMSPEMLMKYGADIFSLFHFWCLLTWLAYFTCFHGWVGKTPGKMLLGIKVSLVSGRELGISVSFLRTAGYFLSAVFFFLGFFWIIVDRKKRGWHDLIAGTIVVKEGKTP
ncbi:MAG: RDD family protein [Syntrophales bacterium]|nr:RDD family protein [Syntrophales bacterium]